MVDLALESALSSLQLSDQSSFYPRQGFEHTWGSETAPFYVVTQGRIPGIYTHWEEASHQVNRFPSAVHKRYIGWSEATAAWDAAHRPPALLSHQSTPSPARLKGEEEPRVSRTPAVEKHRRDRKKSPPTSASAPTTPSGSKKALFVYSRGKDTSIYADRREAAPAVRAGLGDGSFRRIDVTTRLSDALDLAEESALEVIDISDIESD
ncbi:hypothetical protein B0H14DRAFT_3442185 [Mycena olivaceomarginata]|nr:hypothetical protein B0H14DRAFT_3442185 [Mycena olivaceomarginata]